MVSAESFANDEHILHAQSSQTPPVDLAAGIDLAAGDIFKMASPSVVLIENIGEDGNRTGWGSGFLVTADGRILTAFHVIGHTKHARVTLANHDVYDPVSVLDVDRAKDIAFLKIKAVNLPYLKLGRSASVQVGTKLFAIGNPFRLELENTLSEGLLSGIRQAEGFKLFQLSAPTSPGSSGGPVLTAQGEVVGIVEGLIPEGQNLNFAIPIDYAAVLLDARELRSLADYYTPEPTQPSQPPPKHVEPAPAPTASIEHDPISYIASKIGLWTEEDAELELGKPFGRRDGVTGGVVCCDIFRHYSPAPTFSSIELSFHRGSKKVVGVCYYYSAPAAWKTIEQSLGRNYTRTKLSDGRTNYHKCSHYWEGDGPVEGRHSRREGRGCQRRHEFSR